MKHSVVFRLIALLLSVILVLSLLCPLAAAKTGNRRAAQALHRAKCAGRSILY